jgi:hypothetical protein
MKRYASIEEPKSAWETFACSVGIALMLCGQQVAWAVRGYTSLSHSVIFPAIPILIGTGLLVRARWIFGSRITAGPISVAAPILLIFLPAVALSLIDTTFLVEQLTYMAILCVIMLFASMNSSNSFDHIPYYVMAIGGIGCLLADVEFIRAPLQNAARLGLAGNENPLSTALNGSTTAIAALVVGLSSNKNRAWLGVLSVAVFCVGASNVLLSVTRSQIVSVALCIMLFLFFLRGRIHPTCGSPLKWKSRQGLAFIAAAVGGGLAIPSIMGTLFNAKFLSTMITFALERFLPLLMADAKDGSLSAHKYLMDYNWQHLDAIGHGMMAMAFRFGAGLYAHMDYLEAMYDFGIVGGLIFAIIAAVFPIAIIVIRLVQGPITMVQGMLILMFVSSQIDMMSHGTPYSWTQWQATILIYVLFVPRFRSDPEKTESLSDKLMPPTAA